MKSIDIKTTQNVVINYELASVRDRIIAFLLDMVFKVLTIALLWWMFIALISDFSGDGEYLAQLFSFCIVLPIGTFYTLAFELFMNGQTPGKRLLNIKVIRLDGKQPEFYDYVLRWCFRIIDIYLSLGALAVIVSSSSEFAQRLGDMTSNTTVIKLNPRGRITLQEVLRIDSIENYTPEYPGIRNFREEDILLIKHTIDRYHDNRNEIHRTALVQLSENLAQTLEVTPSQTSHIQFLRTLIKDYIVLTR
jgi:uncharacterized RDD family membrane protein YckC